jgi:hypothetical protein
VEDGRDERRSAPEPEGSDVVARDALPCSVRVFIASYCEQPWAGMSGGDVSRHCAKCGLCVHRALSGAIGEARASEADASASGPVVYRREDGTFIARDCPVGKFDANTWRRRRLVRSVGALVLLIAMVLVLRERTHRGGSDLVRLRAVHPYAAICNALSADSKSVAPGPPPFTPPAPLSMPPPSARAPIQLIPGDQLWNDPEDLLDFTLPNQPAGGPG